MEIPDLVENQIREGRIVLCLGAGASLDAKDKKGNHPPTGKQLSALMANRFLGGKYSDSPLHQVAEYAISESDLGQVQSFIRDLLEPFEPTDAHLGMTTFTWHGIATTNYDRLIEKAYEQSPHAVQDIRPLIENGDKVEDNLRDASNILLLKLHGCITRTTNEKCPLILTTDQYLLHRDCRSRIFDHLMNWSYEHPIVFVGHSLEDADIRAVLLELMKIGTMRPRSFIVAPDVDPIRARFWEGRKVTALSGTFHDFIRELDTRIPSHARLLGPLQTSQTSHPISSQFRVAKASLTRATAQFLEVDADYVSSVVSTVHLQPSMFYRGVNQGFSAVEQGLDCRRKLADTILADQFLTDAEGNPSRLLEMVLIRAHAGAGKTVMLRRMAWDAAHEYDCICLFLKPQGMLNVAALQEIIGNCRRRIFLFVDDAGDRARELQWLAKRIGPEGRFLTVVMAERVNEWNILGEPIGPYVTADYELKYLSASEIDALLLLLEKHRALDKLQPLTLEERRAAFKERAGRQLLVALHEATLGKPFEEIIVNEFNSLTPRDAQNIYLSICVLNRLNVAVRAGIIARIHGIAFDEFKQRLFSPLEHVVLAEYDDSIRDYCYRARHAHIADIVFTHILAHSEERFDAYVKCLRALNVDYSVDRLAFWQMVRGRTLLNLFPSHEMVQAIFKVGEGVLGEDGHLKHQMAIYEMNRPNGSVQESTRLLQRALELLPEDVTIQHSVAENKLKLAEQSKTSLERNKYLQEAGAISESLTKSEKTQSHPYHTLAKIGLKKVKSALETGEPEAVVEKLAKEVETALFTAQQKFPGDSHLLDAEAQLASLLADSERFFSALKKAFTANPRSTFVALRLARAYHMKGELPAAQDVLKKALEGNRSDRALHYEYAKLLSDVGTDNHDELLYHLQRSFTEGDANFDAQLRYGRELFLTGDMEGSRKVFERLRNARVAPEVRNRLLYPLPQEFEGKVVKMESSYVFISRDGTGDWIYCHISNVEDNVWTQLVIGARVSFKIAFGIRGVNAVDVRLVGRAVLPRETEEQFKLFKKQKHLA